MSRLKRMAGFCVAIALLATQAWAESNSSVDPRATAVTGPSDGLVDGDAPGWVWRGASEIKDPMFYHGRAHAGRDGCYGAYSFQGSSISVFCMAGPSVNVGGARHKIGRIKISLDGAAKGEFATYAADPQYGDCVFHVSGLGSGIHVLELQGFGGWIVVDYIQVGSIATRVAPAQASSKQQRSLIIWTMVSDHIYSNALNQAALFDFCAAPKGNSANAITMIFCAGMLAADFTNDTSISEMQSFNSAAHDHGLSVYYLCGDPTWATTNESAALQYMQAILAYNTTSTSVQKFDGFVYNVQPYLLPGWPLPNQMGGLIDLLNRSHQLIAAAKQSMPLAATAPYWYDQDQYHYLDRYVIDSTDEVIALDYVNTASRLESNIAGILTYAGQKVKRVWVAVDTAPGNAASFAAAGNAGMEDVLNTCLTDLESRPAFVGYTIDGLDTYAAQPNEAP